MKQHFDFAASFHKISSTRFPTILRLARRHGSKRAVLALLLALPQLPVSAHEGTGRAGLRESPAMELEAEFYAGERGYLHGGFGGIVPIDEVQKIGWVGHFVREDSDGPIFPSLGLEYIRELDDDFELEAFTFGYFPVERQSAWAIGLRGSRRFECSESFSFSPFFGPAYAGVRALDEATDQPVDIGHFMLLGGVALETGPVEITLFGSHSFFSRDPVGLETHVDLEEMTHFAAYENNDGFARNSAGMEIAFALTPWLTLESRYAWIHYEDRTRHSITFTPVVKASEHLEIFAGFQLLRGDGPANNLVVTGGAFSF